MASFRLRVRDTKGWISGSPEYRRSNKNASYEPQSKLLKGGYIGDKIQNENRSVSYGVAKGDTRSLDNGSY